MKSSFPSAFLFFISLLAVNSAWSAGAILVDTGDTGNAVVFKNGLVVYNPETASESSEGKLGRLSNAEALLLLEELFDDWINVTIDGVSTVSLSVTQGEGLGNVNADNIDDFFTYCPATSLCADESSPFVVGTARTGQNPIIFDEDGSITDLVQGVGASSDVLGFAGPRVVETSSGTLYITESQAVLNGKFIDCEEEAAASDSCQSPETTLDDYKGAIFHELGHFLGLDHVQVNLSSASEVLSGDNTNAEAIPTMLPIFIDGEAQLTPHLDDKVSVSMLYPSSNFTSNFCTLQGTVFESNGTTELQGVNVIARDETDPLLNAVSFISGAFYTGSITLCDGEQGEFLIPGLSPGKSYTLEIEKISTAFKGGSSVEPCDPPASGFSAAALDGSFSCETGGETITSGSTTTTQIVTNKTTTTSSSSGGGCSFIQ